MSDCLSNSQVSMDARHRLEAFLDKAIHSDIQFSFCIPRSASPRSRSFGLDTSEHQSCPLPSSSLPSSLSMPLSSPPPTTSSPLSSPLPIGASRASRDNDMLYAHSCILKAAGTPSIERLVSTVVPGSDPEGSVREIRFEDSPPAAVEAVIRYIYLGQRPVLEPNCGYTVKDLMALASYLQIECLQDHCVDLVLGRSSEQSAAYKIKRGSNPTENAVQVLFGWGYKFPRMRRELIRAFVQDQGYGAWADEAAMLQRYRNHEGFGAIVEEMVGERYGWLEQ
ncbi:hypothetical protein BGX31_005251 [Mortierella sp. GBA43]|nr:hypothetical protein BGX31_005251 [Mortierella sp. GBA43]